MAEPEIKAIHILMDQEAESVKQEPGAEYGFEGPPL